MLALLAKGRRVARPPPHAQRGSMPPLFQGYVAVDWSAASDPVHGENSIWIAALLPDQYEDENQVVRFTNPRSRTQAMNYLNALLNEANARGNRLLCGFDFAYGYPLGTAPMMAHGGNWAALWGLFAQHFRDDIDGRRNFNDRFQVAAALNHHIRAVAAPD